jgi:hypothetical protein
MARPTITDLKLTSDRGYWPSRAAPGRKGEHFESKAFCEAEDIGRVKSTLKASEQTKNVIDKRAARKLAGKLDYKAKSKKPPRSMASSRHMRRVRNRLFSQISKFVAKYPGKVTTFTVIKRGWEYSPGELLDADLDKLLDGFLSDVNRRGAGRTEGWLIAFVHGEHETPAGVFRLHLHGIVAGDMIGVVDKLRQGRKYKYRKDEDVRFRVRIDRKPLTNLPYPLTYCLKSYWPWKHVVMTANGKRRTRRHKRIRDPYHTLVLQFFDKHNPSDFVVLKHVQVKDGCLCPTASRNSQVVR